jgi:ATP-binding protein involved in chromosome partitioning
MSMDLLLPGDDAPLRWRAPAAPEFLWQSTLEGGVLREFLADTRWGTLDHLLIDAPPGTDKLTRLLQLLPRADAVLLVTTPSEIARFMGGKAVRVALEMRREGAEDGGSHAEGAEGAEGAEVGLVVNMSGHVCEACGHRAPLFGDGDASSAAVGSPDVPTWAEIPFDRRLAHATDRGEPFVLVEPDAPAARVLRELARRIDGQDAAGTQP